MLAHWDAARANQAEVEQCKVEALDLLGLTQLVTSIDGLSPVGAASILAETGNLTRFTSARAIVKLAGLAPANDSPAPPQASPPLRRRPARTTHRRLAGRMGMPAAQQGV